jgi:hypothetical protein
MKLTPASSAVPTSRSVSAWPSPPIALKTGWSAPPNDIAPRPISETQTPVRPS